MPHISENGMIQRKDIFQMVAMCPQLKTEEYAVYTMLNNS